MNTYSITEEQLDELASLNPEWPAEVERREVLVKQIKSQVLVPVEKMREAFQSSFGQTQDEIQKGLLDVAAGDRTGLVSPDEVARGEGKASP